MQIKLLSIFVMILLFLPIALAIGEESMIKVEDNVIDKVSGLNYTFKNATIEIDNKLDFNFFVMTEKSNYSIITEGIKVDEEKSMNNLEWNATGDIFISQKLQFFDDKTLKITHIVDKLNVEDSLDFIYSLKLSTDGVVKINGSVCQYDGKCDKPALKHDVVYSYVEFSDELFFTYPDLLGEYYLSSYEIIDGRLNLVFRAFDDKKTFYELDPSFTTTMVDSSDMSTLGEDKFFLTFHSTTGTPDTLNYTVLYANGTVYKPTTAINNSLGTTPIYEQGVHSNCFNSSHCVVTYHDSNNQDNAYLCVIDIENNNQVCSLVHDGDSVNYPMEIDNHIYDATRIGVGYARQNNCSYFEYNYTGSSLVKHCEQTISAVDCGGIGMSGNSSNSSIIFWDETNNDISFQRWTKDCKNTTTIIDFDTGASGTTLSTYPVDILSYDSFDVYVFIDDSPYDESLVGRRWYNGTIDYQATLVRDSSSYYYTSSDMTKLNESIYAAMIGSPSSVISKYYVNTVDNVRLFNASYGVQYGFSITSKNQFSSICNKNFIVQAYQNWQPTAFNNSIWDGVCIPTYNSTNYIYNITIEPSADGYYCIYGLCALDDSSVYWTDTYLSILDNTFLNPSYETLITWNTTSAEGTNADLRNVSIRNIYFQYNVTSTSSEAAYLRRFNDTRFLENMSNRTVLVNLVNNNSGGSWYYNWSGFPILYTIDLSSLGLKSYCLSCQNSSFIDEIRNQLIPNDGLPNGFFSLGLFYQTDTDGEISSKEGNYAPKLIIEVGCDLNNASGNVNITSDCYLKDLGMFGTPRNFYVWNGTLTLDNTTIDFDNKADNIARFRVYGEQGGQLRRLNGGGII